MQRPHAVAVREVARRHRPAPTRAPARTSCMRTTQCSAGVPSRLGWFDIDALRDQLPYRRSSSPAAARSRQCRLPATTAPKREAHDQHACHAHAQDLPVAQPGHRFRSPRCRCCRRSARRGTCSLCSSASCRFDSGTLLAHVEVSTARPGVPPRRRPPRWAADRGRAGCCCSCRCRRAAASDRAALPSPSGVLRRASPAGSRRSPRDSG